MIFLGIKIAVFIVMVVTIFLFVFGIARCCGQEMEPAYKDGDLVIYYRLQNDFNQGDSVIIKKAGKVQIRRIIAKAGDTVDLTDEGLKINGYLQQEHSIYSETLPYTEGIRFPIEVKDDEYFVLGDNRFNAEDSRIYGVVKSKEIRGIVISLIRRRGL